MKKMYTYLAMAMMAMMSLTSCTLDYEDRAEARTLEGTWTGVIDHYYYDRWGLSGDSYSTAFYFERENAYGGWGYEVDYDMRNPADYWYCEFSWEIVHGTICIQYYDRDYSEIRIYDYMLDDYRFSGDMDDGYADTRTHFSLTYNNHFNWNRWTRGITRGATDDYHCQAGGKFLKTDKEKSELDTVNTEF